MLAAAGYEVRMLNTINFKKSMHYNPFSYIHSEKDILKLVTALILNTKGESKGGDDFWVSATRSHILNLVLLPHTGQYIHFDLSKLSPCFL